MNLDFAQRTLANQEKILELSQHLNPAELERAAKFIHPQHRDRWIIARSYLRQILSIYLDTLPGQIEFGYGSLGKPYVLGHAIEFNLSHSQDLAVYGISPVHPIGIDIEYTRSLPFVEMVNRFFSPTEQTQFQALPTALHQAAFFHAWTQKEACLKASGTGLHTPLDRIEVSIDPRTPPQILRMTGKSHPVTNWQILSLTLPTDYVGAVAVGADKVEIEYPTWPDTWE
jgi:4'-phosphopantetheinyl transferase